MTRNEVRFLHATTSMIRTAVLVVFASTVLLSCQRQSEQQQTTPPPAPATERPSSGTIVEEPTRETTPREVVEELGRRMKEVSTTAPADVAAATIRRTYLGLVKAELLDRWASAPATAPGRQVSSPWPDRIEVQDVSQNIVTGEVVEVTSTGEASRTPVRITLERVDGRWMISDYRVEEVENATRAVDALRAYYDAINTRDYARAYTHWGPSPKQTLDDFTHGFADTESVELKVGTPSRVEPAAGSRYVEIPVTIEARKKSGARERFEGTYTMRRVLVDGAPESARRWHIHRASLRLVSEDA